MNACESILGLSPYQGGKPIEELERELGIKNIVKLASNENPLGASPKVVEAMKLSLKEVHRYPDGNGYELKKAISENLDVATEMISLGNGSNELLELIGDSSVYLEEYARTMIGQEELHVLEIGKMLKN